MVLAQMVTPDVNQQNRLQNDDNQLVHQNKKKQEEQSIKTDSMTLAMLSLYTGNKIRKIMEEDRYWTYVLQNDSKYSDRVVDEAIKIKKKFKSDPKKFLPLVPPKKDPGGGAGGAPPAMGSSNKRVIVADGGKIYLWRKDGNYRLASTIVGKIFAGNYPLYKADGSVFDLDLIKGNSEAEVRDRNEIMAPKGGNIDRLLDSLERGLPQAMMSSLRKGLEEMNIPSAARIAQSLMAKMEASTSAMPLRLYDVLVNIMSPSDVIGLSMSQRNISEPPEIEKLRQTIGAACEPFVNELTQALGLDNIPFRLSPLPDGDKNPRELQRRKRANDEYKKGMVNKVKAMTEEAPKMLSLKDARADTNIKSVIMTAMGTNDPSTILECAKTIIWMMRTSQPLYAIRPLTNAEAERLHQRAYDLDPGIYLQWFDLLKQMVKAYNGDDADFMDAVTYAKAKSEDDPTFPKLATFALGQVATQQKRKDIITAMPSLAINQDSKNEVNIDAISMLDVSDKDARKVVFESWIRGKSSVLGVTMMDKVLVDKMMDVTNLKNNPGAVETALMRLIGTSSATNPAMMFYASAKAYETNMVSSPEGAGLVKEDLIKDKLIDVAMEPEMAEYWLHDSGFNNLLALSIIDKNPNSTVLKATRTKPYDLFTMKPETADKYMAMARVDQSGEKIPTANEIHSLPKNILGLVKSLYLVKDSAGLLVCLNLIAEKIKVEPTPDVEYSLQYTMSALKEFGHAQEAQGILVSNKIRMDENGWRKIMSPSMIPTDSVSGQHIYDSFETGDMISAAKFTNILYKRNPSAATEIVSKLPQNDVFLGMLDPALSGRNTNQAADVEATMLPNGIVVIGKNGIYSFSDGENNHCYACSKEDSLLIAMEKTQGK